MQRQFYILSTALLLLLACSREEGADSGQPGETAVCFTATADAQMTKATTTSLLSDNAKVSVYAWMGSDLSTSASTAPAHSNNYTVKNNNSNGSLTPVGSAMKVQTGVAYFFYALSTNSDAAVPALNGDYTTEVLVNGVDYLMAVAKNSNQGYTFQANGNSDVPLTFSHLATRVVLTVQPADADGYTSADALSVSIASIDGTGSYIDLSASAIHWPASDAEPVTGGIPLDRLEGGQKKEAQKEASGQQKFTVSFILLPVSSPAQGIPVQLNFTGLKFEDAATGVNKSYTAQLKGSGANSLVLEGGKTYNFDVRISRHSASFSAPEVVSWEEVETDVDNMKEETTS